jgi:hypothetical protein
MSKIATSYPPNKIKVADETSTDVPNMLEAFFLDLEDIKEIIKASFDINEQNKNFFMNYTTLSAICLCAPPAWMTDIVEIDYVNSLYVILLMRFG